VQCGPAIVVVKSTTLRRSKTLFIPVLPAVSSRTEIASLRSQ
jgi:hypothetical protein